MAINPLHPYIPQEHPIREQKTEQETPIPNQVQAEVVQQPGEPIPIQQSQEAAQTNYTDREQDQKQQQQEDDDLEATEHKTRKSFQALHKGLEQVADGIQQLRDLQDNPSLDERLRHISTTGNRLVADIEQTVKETVDAAVAAGQRFFEVSVAELTAVRVTIDGCLVDIAAAQTRIPTPHISDYSAKAQALRVARSRLTEYASQITEKTNSMLELAEQAICKLLSGQEMIVNGYESVRQGEADGFKVIESGFKKFFASIYELTDCTTVYRQQAENLIRSVAEVPPQLEAAIGGRAALGIPEKMAVALWTNPDKTERCWRQLQGHLSRLTTTNTLFGNTIDEIFEKASKAVLGEGQIAVDCVHEDLGDLKSEAKQSLTPLAARAIDQILEGAEQVEEALDELVATGKQKHDRVKRGSTAKLPSHFNVRL